MYLQHSRSGIISPANQQFLEQPLAKFNDPPTSHLFELNLPYHLPRLIAPRKRL